MIKTLKDWDIDSFEDFELLDWSERRWLWDNGLAPDYWFNIEWERMDGDVLDAIYE